MVQPATSRFVMESAKSSHTHTSSQITDFTEAAQDAIALLLQSGTGVTLSYNDTANTLTITGTGTGVAGLDAEAVRDTIGIAMVGAGLISIVVNDPADTITITTTATANATDAALRDRASHTGVQDIATVLNLQSTLDAKVDDNIYVLYGVVQAAGVTTIPANPVAGMLLLNEGP